MSNLTYTYTSAVPQGTQQINNTQVPIENNFEDIAQLIAVNHSPFNTIAAPDATPGLHDIVTYFAQSADPTPVANAINMYSKAVANDPNLYELFYQYPNGTVNQLTGSASAGTSTNTGGALVYSQLPFPGYTGYQYIGGGLLMKFGYCTITAPINNVSTFTSTFSYPVATNIPAFTSTPFLLVGQGGTTLTFFFGYITAISATTYSVTFSGTSSGVSISQNVYWMAIGV